MRIPIHREGWPFIAIFAVVNALLTFLSPWAVLAFVPLTIWCIAFFRDPERTPPAGDLKLVSPADGKLLPTVEAVPPEELGLGPAPRRRLSIFMDVFNVHVNRMSLRLRPRLSTVPEYDIVVVQIAGLVARRIVCDVKQGDFVERGARYGMIRFGSRLDIYLPTRAKILIEDGSVTVAGETVLAEL